MKTGIHSLEDFNDFLKVFMVFGSFPFFEKWSTDEVRNEFEVNRTTGKIFGYYVDGECVGFISMRDQQPNEHPVHYGHDSKVLYISDIAVLPQHRRRGIATELLDYTLSYASSMKYNYVYFRINENNPMAMEIAKRHGFRKEYDSFQIISHPHIKEDGRHSEERIFMTKKM